MRAFVNDALRRIIGLSLVMLGVLCEVQQRVQMLGYRPAQRRLRSRYGISDTTPVLPYELQCHPDAGGQYASTSGSTTEPKRVPYPPERVRRAQWLFIDAFARALARSPWQRQSFYLFSSLHEDDSLTSLMMAEGGAPSYLATLQAPYRLHSDPALQVLAQQYGDAAVRLWVIAVANPGILYSTNPSTLWAFLDTMHREWSATTALIRDVARHPIARRIVSRGASARLRRIAESDGPLPFHDIAPAVHTYVCWTGGYVEPFLRRLAEYLPASRYRLLPMYSMSTETPETTPCFRGNHVAFVPMAPGVLYEFMRNDGSDQLRPDELTVGESYRLIVSDAYGLRRYDTDDVFSCVGYVGGLPDLRFEHRQSLSYSFTGEKLTGQQLSMALGRLRTELPELRGFLTCVPSSTGLPHYLLVGGADAPMERAAMRCDAMLAEVNAEYRAKRESGRLGPMRGVTVSWAEFVARVGGDNRESWEAQFKFLPLYTRTWESGGRRLP